MLTFTLTVTDALGLADATPDQVVITVTNQAPIANAGADQTVNTNATVTLDGSGSSDPDSDTPLTYSWQQTGGTAVTLSDATAESPTFTAPGDPTVLTFTLTVTDALGLADATPDQVVVTVTTPSVDLHITKTVTPTTAAPGDPITYTITFSNTGSALASGVVITDIVPVSVTNTSVISSGVAITDTGYSPPYVWDVADLAFGQGGVITITGQLSATLTTGTFTNTVVITTTATDANPGNNSSDAGVTVGAPEMDVQRPAGTSIADGGTDNVGNQTVGTVNQTYTIDNTAGTATLNVTGVTPSNYVNSSGFAVVTALPLNVAAGGTATLDLSFDVDANGAFSLDMDIANNDADENPYDIAIQGTGTTGGTIVIEKVTDPASVGVSFSFTDTIAAPNNFNLDYGQTKTFNNVAPGPYTVTETDPTVTPGGYNLTGLSCDETGIANSSGDVVTRTATINLEAGETITCTFTNTQRGTIIVEKQTDPDGVAGTFTFTGDAAGTISDNGTIVVSDLAPGTYTATEDDPTPAFDLTAITCGDGGSATPSTWDVGTRTATFNLDPGETVKCTFTNRPSADLDGNGEVNAADLSVLVSQRGECAGCAADLDGNGWVNLADLSILVSQWGD